LFRGDMGLYRVGDHPLLSRTHVDGQIQLFRFYPPDCVLYTTRRSYDGRVIYAVCGDRTPVSVATRDYRMDEFGLESRQPPDVIDGRPFLNGMRIPIGRIKAVAKKAPPFDPDFDLSFNKFSRQVEPIPFHLPMDAEEQDDRESTVLHDVVASGDYGYSSSVAGSRVRRRSFRYLWSRRSSSGYSAA
jgi:hypothetical protein